MHIATVLAYVKYPKIEIIINSRCDKIFIIKSLIIMQRFETYHSKIITKFTFYESSLDKFYLRLIILTISKAWKNLIILRDINILCSSKKL